MHYCSADLFSPDYAVTSYLSKYKGLNTGLDLRQVAIGKFSQSEDRCAFLNRRITEGRPIPGADAAILAAKRKISTLLGPFHYGKVLDHCRWGPGATASISAREATVDNKVLEPALSVTLHALPFFKAVMTCDTHWLRARGIAADGPTSVLNQEFQVVEGGRLTVVPKNAKTDRTILVEPTGNLFLQFGVGGFIRQRLKTVGVDLNSQELNQRLAREGLATIDLKAASDSVYRELVYQLLPLDWAHYMDCIRSKRYSIDKGPFMQLHKFSSMGNGFTFELESLIFWALAKSVMDEEDVRGCVSVFGDDIVVPVSIAPRVCAVLEAVGFELNREKTFIEGPFRESCGSHWFGTRDVTPVYQKELTEEKHEFTRAFNRLVRLARRLGPDGNARDSRVRNSLRTMIRTAPRGYLDFAQPDVNGPDDGLLVFESDPFWLKKAASQRLIQLPKHRVGDEPALLAITLRFGCFTDNQPRGVQEWIYSLPYRGRVSIRGGGAYAVRRRPRSFWTMSDAPWT
jgi:hypothetical protein